MFFFGDKIDQTFSTLLRETICTYRVPIPHLRPLRRIAFRRRTRFQSRKKKRRHHPFRLETPFASCVSIFRRTFRETLWVPPGREKDTDFFLESRIHILCYPGHLSLAALPINWKGPDASGNIISRREDAPRKGALDDEKQRSSKEKEE